MNKNSISYYGKIPSHGDFISHLVPRAFTSVWDTWLQESLVYWKTSLGENWVVDYLTMPSYRFILSTGIAGETIWCGLIFGSRDHAGRLFPFTVCLSLSAKEVTPFSLFDEVQDWLDKLEPIATQCLMPDFDKESLNGSFQKELEQLAKEWSISATIENDFTCSRNANQNFQPLFAWHTNALEKAEKPRIKNISNSLLNNLLTEFSHGYSLWWTKKAKDLMVCQGLPEKEMTAAFVDNKWNKRGWLTHRLDNH